MISLYRAKIPVAVAVCTVVASTLSGCVTYLTPGEGAPMSALAGGSAADTRLPEALFPATIALARVQAAEYRSFGAEGIGDGRYSVVYAREVEQTSDFDALHDWPQVVNVVPMSQLSLPSNLNSFQDLLNAAAGVQADILLAYTFDTRFHVENDTFAPEQKITLGVLPGRSEERRVGKEC